MLCLPGRPVDKSGSTRNQPKTEKEKIPAVLTSKDFREYIKKKEDEKEQLEKEKRKIARELKEIEKSRLEEQKEKEKAERVVEKQRKVEEKEDGRTTNCEAKKSKSTEWKSDEN